MASMDEIYRAFLKADAAGDTQSARILAGYIRERTGYTGLEEEEKEERTFGKYAKEAFKGLIPGAVSGIETAIAGAASVLPEEAEQAVRRKVSEVAEPIRETFAPAPGYEDTAVRQLSEAVGSSGPFIGAGLLGKLAITGLAAATGAGEARKKAEQEKTTEGERAAATALGIGPGLLEAAPPLRILNRFGFGKEAIEEVIGFAPSLRRIAKAGGEEALQEASTQVLQNLIAKGVYKPEEEVFGGVTEAAGLGGGAGAIVGAIAELALGRRLRGVEPPPEAREEGITEEPTPPVTPAAVAEEPRPARVAPTEQMELPLGAEPVQIPMFGEEEASAPTPSLYRPAEEALAGLKPRSRAYKEEAKDLGLKLDRKGNVKPNQFVFEQPETEVPITQGRFEFEVSQEQPELPLTAQPAEGQMDIFGGVPMPPGGEMPSVPPPAELPVAEEVPEEQFALNLPGIPMERLTPRDRILRAMAITEDRKTVDNLKFATGLPRAELRETLNTLKEEGTIKYRPSKFEWELTPAGADYVRTPRKKIGSARIGRGAAVSVPPAGTETPPSAESTERGMAGAGTPPSVSDVGEGEGEPALTKKPPMTLREQVMMLGKQVDEERAVDPVAELRTRAIDAFDNDQINEKTYLAITDELKKPAPNLARATSLLEGTAKPKREKDVGLKFQLAPEWATKFEKDVGGQVVYSDADTALVRGSSILSGQNVYMAVDRKTGMRTRVDIDSFTGKLFTPEQKQRLVDAKKEVVARDTELFNENPDGPFTGAASNVVTSDGLNPNYGNYLSNLMNSMGLGDIRVFLVHPEDVQNQADKYKLYGQYSSAMSAGLDAGEEGSVRPYGPNRKDFYISMKSGLSEGRNLEIIGHELGHLIERVAYNNAPAEVKTAIRAEYDKWLKDTKGKQGAELVRALRNRETAEAQAAKIGPDTKLSDSYWRSFSEWFADNTSKWATTSEKPVSIVEKFFADLAKKLRQLVAKITGNEFVPAKSVKDFLDAMGPGSADSWIAERTKPSYDPASANAASYSMSPDERIKADRALVNSVGSSQNRLPEPTARIKEGARTAASMVPRWLRRGVFSFESTHQLADMYRPYTDKLDELWDLQNRDGAALRAKMDKVRTISERGRKVMSKYSPAARDRIYNLFLDTTVNQVEVLDSAADPVLKNNAAIKDMGIVMKPATESSLYKQFSQLPQPVRDLYRDLRLAYLEDANEMEQILSQYLTPSEWQKLQMEFNKKRLPVYLPLYRSGEYKLVYTDKDGETVSRQFETSEEREKAFRQVRASGIPESKIVRKMASEFAASDIPPAGFYGKVVAKLRENDVDEKTIAKLFDLYMDYMPATSVLQLRRKRQNTPGYEPDVLRAYASVGGAYARRLVNMRFMPQINKAFEDLKADLGQGSFWVSYKDSKGRTVRNGYDTDELRQMAVRQAVEDGADRNSVKFFSLSDEEAADLESVVQGQIDFFNNPKLDNYASKAAYFSFTMYMGGNVSSAIIDLTHIPMVVYSLLGGKYGFGRAAASMKRAHRYYMNPNRKLPSEIAELPSVMKRATEDGVLGEQRIMDLAEFNNRFGDFGSKALETKARVDRALGSIFAISDRYNRGLTFISAYELAKNQLQKKGLKGDELLEAAYTDAKRAVYDSYGSSFPKAGPSIMQNGLARLALTFKRFALNRMWLLVKALDQATRGESKEVKNIARAQLLGFYGMAYVFSGAQGLPLMGAFQLLASALNGMFGDDDELYDIQDATRQAVGMFNYRGPINYLLGVDIASRSGWDQMLWRDDPRRIAEVGPATYAMEQMLGPAFSYAVNAPRAFEHFSEGRFSQGMETLTPRVIANMFKAFRYGTEGALTKDNIPVVDDISKYNQFMQLLGFAPTEVGEAYQQAGVAKKFEREILDRRDGLIRRAMMAIVSDDDEGRADALKDIMKFNEKHPGKPITDESISRSVTNHYVKLNQSVNGVRVDPKLAQEIYDQLGYNDETMLDESELEEQEDLATDLLYED